MSRIFVFKMCISFPTNIFYVFLHCHHVHQCSLCPTTCLTKKMSPRPDTAFIPPSASIFTPFLLGTFLFQSSPEYIILIMSSVSSSQTSSYGFSFSPKASLSPHLHGSVQLNKHLNSYHALGDMLNTKVQEGPRHRF